MLSQRFAVALIGLGSLVLLVQSGFFLALPGLLWLALLGGLGLLLWRTTAGRLATWQRLTGLGLLLLLALPALAEFTGALVLGLPAVVFALAYLREPRRRWWAALCAGALSSLSAVVLFEELFPAWDAGPLFLLGLAATFSFLYFAPSARGGQRWALYPAIGCALLTLLANDPRGGGGAWLLPLGLIGLGLGMLGVWRRR